MGFLVLWDSSPGRNEAILQGSPSLVIIDGQSRGQSRAGRNAQVRRTLEV
jgi:hypothetical protein